MWAVLYLIGGALCGGFAPKLLRRDPDPVADTLIFVAWPLWIAACIVIVVSVLIDDE